MISELRSPSTIGVYTGKELAAYGFGHGHPFGPDRLTAFRGEAGGITSFRGRALPGPANAQR